MDATTLAAITAALGAVVTAVATIALWRVTGALARETTRMADASGQPQIVATLRPNRWTMMYADLTISNSGNASAFSIRMEFEPPLEIERQGDAADERPLPFQEVSVLRPGETLSSDIGLSFPLIKKSYRVTTSWLRHPGADERESLSYTTSMADVKGVMQLGAADPLVQIAEEVKHIREDWRSVANGGHRIGTEIYTSADRMHERRLADRYRRERQRQHEEQERAATAAAESQTLGPTPPPVTDGDDAP